MNKIQEIHVLVVTVSLRNIRLFYEMHPLWVPFFHSLYNEPSSLRSKAGDICRVVWCRELNDPFLVLDGSKES